MNCRLSAPSPLISRAKVNGWGMGLLGVLAGASLAFGQTDKISTWDGGGANGNWSTAANWGNDTVPNETTDYDRTIVFAGNSQLASVMNLAAPSGGFNVKDVIFDVGAGAFVLSESGTIGLDMLGNRLTTVASNVTNNSSNLQTINLKLISRGDLSSTLSFNTIGADMLINGQIVGIGATSGITKTGANVLTLANAANSYQGATNVNAGTLRAGASGNVFGNNSVVTLADAAGVTVDLNNFNASMGGLNGGGATGGNVTLGSGTLTFSGTTGSNTFGGVISGTGGIIKTGGSTQALAGINTYTGVTQILGGSLTITNDRALGALPANASTTNVLIDGGTLRSSAAMEVDVSANRRVAIGAAGGTLLAAGSGFNFWIRGPIVDNAAGAGALTIASGAGQYVAASSNSTYSGGTVLASGSTTIVVGDTTASGGVVTQGAFGTGVLRFAGGSIRATTSNARTIHNQVSVEGTAIFSNGGPNDKSLTFEGAVNLNAANRTFNVGTNAAVAGVYLNQAISNGGLTKTGAGTLVLGTANSYALGTTVNAGRLTVNGTGGTGAGSVAVNTGGTLAGRGSITGGSSASITFGAGSFLVVGQTHAGVTNGGIAGVVVAESFTMSTAATAVGSIAFDAAATLQFDLISNLAGADNTVDENDLLFLSTGTGGSIVAGGTVALANANLGSGTWGLGSEWKLIDWTGQTVTGAFAVDGSGAALAGGLAWEGVSRADGFYVRVAAVPEPARGVLGLLGAVVVFGVRRRRGAVC